VQCDSRLKALVEEALSPGSMPDFDQNRWYVAGKQHLSGSQQLAHHSSLHDGASGELSCMLPQLMSTARAGLVNHGLISPDSFTDGRSMKLQPNNLSSPSSGIESLILSHYPVVDMY
jgi:hypothetical protein